MIGSWPFCPDHSPGRSSAIGDEFIGGLTLENLGPEPVTIRSRTELRRELKARGLVECVRHVPVPGSDKSPHTSSWASVDLDAARALAERQAQTKAPSTPHRPNPETIAVIKQVYEEFRAGRLPTPPQDRP